MTQKNLLQTLNNVPKRSLYKIDMSLWRLPHCHADKFRNSFPVFGQYLEMPISLSKHSMLPLRELREQDSQVSVHPRQHNPEKLNFARKALEEMQRFGFIPPSNICLAASRGFKKEYGNWRHCSIYNNFDNVTVRVSYPLAQCSYMLIIKSSINERKRQK